MKKRLSSLVTPYYKFAPPVLFAYCLFWLTRDFRAESLLLGMFFLLLFGFLAKLSSRLKKVYLRDDVLHVSNYLKTITIPLSEVVSVKVSRGWQPQTISLKLRSPSEFGEKILIIPWGFGLLASEVAEEIRSEIAAQHNNGMHPTRDTLLVK